MSERALQSLLQQPVWSKNVILWVGSGETLDNVLQGHQHLSLDLLDLLPDDDKLPGGYDERGELLHRLLDERLQQIRPKAGCQRVVLCVRNAAVLARYGVGLGPFYDWFAGSDTMTVLHLGRIRPIGLPETVSAALRLDPDCLPNYFRPLLHRPENLCVEA